MGRDSRYLVLGAGSQVGQALLSHVPTEEHIWRARESLDVTNHRAVRQAFEDVQPTVVINLAGIVDPLFKAADLHRLWQVNVSAVANLARCCVLSGCALVQLSSADVFGMDDKPTPYPERQTAGACSPVALSHLAAEHAILNIANGALPSHYQSGFRWYIVRSAYIYSASQNGLRANLLRQMLATGLRSRSEIPAPADVSISPISAMAVAKELAFLAANVRSIPSSVYHVAARHACQFYDVFRLAREVLRRPVAVRAATREDLASYLHVPASYIPRNQALDCQSWETQTSRPLPAWEKDMGAFLRQYAHEL